MKSKKIKKEIKDSPSTLAFSSPTKRGVLSNLVEAQKNIKNKFKKAYITRMKRERELDDLFKPVTSKFNVTTVEQKRKRKKNDDNNEASNGESENDTSPPRTTGASAGGTNGNFFNAPRGTPKPTAHGSAGPRLENNAMSLTRMNNTPTVRPSQFFLNNPESGDYFPNFQTPTMRFRDFVPDFQTARGTVARRAPLAVRRLHTDANFANSPELPGEGTNQRKRRNRARETQGRSIESNFIPYNVNDRIIYEYFDDPNELCDRLRLLTSSRAAGNTNHMQEINSIIEELRELGYVH